MPQQSNYAPTTCDRIIERLKTWEYGNYFKQFFYGNPRGQIPEDQLPCIIVDLVATPTVKAGPTGMDLLIETIDVGIAINRWTYIDDFDTDTVSWQKQLELMVQGNDPLTQQYDPTTLLGVLRTQFTLGSYAVDQTMSINYGEAQRAGSQTEEDYTGEAHIICTFTHYQEVPVRT